VEVLLQGIVVELLELIGILEVRAERVLAGIVLTEDVCPQLRWPPVDVLGAAASDVGGLDGTLAFGLSSRAYLIVKPCLIELRVV